MPSFGIFIQEQLEAIVQSVDADHLLVIFQLHKGKGIGKVSLGSGRWQELPAITLQYRGLLQPLVFRFVDQWAAAANHEVIKWLGGTKPSQIHSHVWAPGGVVASHLAKQLNVPHVHSEHWSGTRSWLIPRPKHQKRWEDLAAVSVVSNFLAEGLKTVVRKPQPVLIPNVVDSNIFTYHAKTKDPHTIRLVALSSTHKPKRLDVLCSAVELLTQQLPQTIKLTIVGTTPDVAPIKQWLGKPWLETHAYVPKAKYAYLLHESDLMVHASDFESFSLAVAEALCTGTPIVASAIPRFERWLQADEAILAKNETQAFAEAIKQALAKEWDYRLIAQRHANVYSPRAVGLAFRSWYPRLG